MDLKESQKNQGSQTNATFNEFDMKEFNNVLFVQQGWKAGPTYIAIWLLPVERHSSFVDTMCLTSVSYVSQPYP